MIIYDLACRQHHLFEGWFASAAAFDTQLAAGLVRCPVCDDSQVEKRLSAKVRVSRPRTTSLPPTDETANSASTMVADIGSPQAVQHVSTHSPAQFLSALREMVRATENVGERFPEEARRMHYNEIPARPIRGQANSEDVEALAEEGIDLTLLPPFLLHDPN